MDQDNTDLENGHDIDVSVDTSFIEAQSDEDESRFVFAYTVTIHNSGHVPAKLVNQS